MSKPDRSLRELDQERIVPWGDKRLFAWHLARYRFALQFLAQNRALDVGCGEGYGAMLMASHAREVVAVDYSPAAINHPSAVRDEDSSFRKRAEKPREVEDEAPPGFGGTLERKSRTLREQRPFIEITSG